MNNNKKHKEQELFEKVILDVEQMGVATSNRDSLKKQYGKEKVYGAMYILKSNLTKEWRESGYSINTFCNVKKLKKAHILINKD